MPTTDLQLLAVIDDLAPERAAANAELVARAALGSGIEASGHAVSAGQPPWFGLESEVRRLEREGLVDVVVEGVPTSPGDESFPAQRVRIVVTDAGRDALHSRGSS
jgi:hypothetical protein